MSGPYQSQYHQQQQAPYSSQGPPPGPPGGPIYQPAPPSDPRLKAWFDAVDVDKSGQVDAREFQAAMRSAGLDFSLPSAAALIRMYDRDRSGTVDFNEFQGIHQFVLSVQQSFFQFDHDRSGSLDINEVGQALQLNGFNLDQTVLASSVMAFDPQRKGSLKLDEFISLAAFLAQARNVFAAFDPQRQGRITLDINQFFYCAGLLR